MAKVYAIYSVDNRRVRQVVGTWELCKAITHKVPAVFKSFDSLPLAIEWFQDQDNATGVDYRYNYNKTSIVWSKTKQEPTKRPQEQKKLYTKPHIKKETKKYTPKPKYNNGHKGENKISREQICNLLKSKLPKHIILPKGLNVDDFINIIILKIKDNYEIPKEASPWVDENDLEDLGVNGEILPF